MYEKYNYMSLTRYEFDILSFVEENGEKCYGWRELSDSLSISGTTVTDTKKTLIERKLLKNDNEKLSVSEDGLKELEPYRVKRAVIFAAGFGSRMMPVTLTTPKPLVEVKGIRIIDRLIDALVAKDIKDITIVRGYLKEKFNVLLDKYPFITLLDNDHYDKENNISSALIAGEKIDQCYICAGDLLVTNPNIIRKYNYCSNYLASYAEETDDWCFTFENGYTGEYKKGGKYCFNQYEIAYWNKEDSAKLRLDFKKAYETEENGKDLFWEFIPLVLYHDQYHVEIRQCSRADIMEIDNFYELCEVDLKYKDYEKSRNKQEI